MTPKDIFAREAFDFVLKYADPAGQRLLEVGCGNGELGVLLQNAGAELVAVDSDENCIRSAVKKGVDARHADFLDFECERFGLIIFSRSLHHIHSLPDAILRARDLLTDGGVLLVEDFSLENAELRTARWYYDMLAVFSKSKLIHEHHPHVDDPLKAWEDEHRHDPPLNESREMINEIGEGFSNYLVETNPYLYRSICSSLPNDEFGYDLTETVLEMERSLIREGAVSPVGTRIIAKNL